MEIRCNCAKIVEDFAVGSFHSIGLGASHVSDNMLLTQVGVELSYHSRSEVRAGIAEKELQLREPVLRELKCPW